MSGPTPESTSLQDDLSNVINALTAGPQALSMISTWEDDPFSEAAPTANPPVSARGHRVERRRG
jgi:hypothetical protein